MVGGGFLVFEWLGGNDEEVASVMEDEHKMQERPWSVLMVEGTICHLSGRFFPVQREGIDRARELRKPPRPN